MSGSVTLPKLHLLLWLVATVLKMVYVSLLMQVRQSAGLLLKNNLKAQYAATTEEFRKYIKVRHWSMSCKENLLRHLEPWRAFWICTSQLRIFSSQVAAASCAGPKHPWIACALDSMP